MQKERFRVLCHGDTGLIVLRFFLLVMLLLDLLQ